MPSQQDNFSDWWQWINVIIPGKNEEAAAVDILPCCPVVWRSLHSMTGALNTGWQGDPSPWFVDAPQQKHQLLFFCCISDKIAIPGVLCCITIYTCLLSLVCSIGPGWKKLSKTWQEHPGLSMWMIWSSYWHTLPWNFSWPLSYKASIRANPPMEKHLSSWKGILGTNDPISIKFTLLIPERVAAVFLVTALPFCQHHHQNKLSICAHILQHPGSFKP